jgi:hypothetical protein
MLKTFVGFKGKMAAAQIGDVAFVILAKNERQLEIIWASLLANIPLDPAGIKSAILIESNLLPDRKVQAQSTEPNLLTKESIPPQ